MSSPDRLAAEYAALRRGVGAHRVALDALGVRGPEASTFLQGQLSQDLDPVAVGSSVPALLLQPDGKLCALVRATRTAEDAWVLDTAAGFGEEVAARLTRFRLRTKVDLERLDWPCVALRGEGVAAALRDTAPPGGAAWVVPVEWQGTRGADLVGPGADALVPAAATWCGDAAWEALRIEAGIPAMGPELDETTIAAEAGLVERAVSLTKGCYTGQELVARLDARGNRVARRLCGVVAPGLGPEEAAPLVGAALHAPGREKPVGRCTSAAWCPGLGEVGALAYLHRSVEVPAELVAGQGPDGGRPVRGVALPLVAG